METEYYINKGRAIAGMLDAMKQLDAVDKAKFDPDEMEPGMEFKMKMTFYLIGVFDAAAEAYAARFLGMEKVAA